MRAHLPRTYRKLILWGFPLLIWENRLLHSQELAIRQICIAKTSEMSLSAYQTHQRAKVPPSQAQIQKASNDLCQKRDLCIVEFN